MVGILRERINDRILGWVNRVSALMIAGFAVWVAADLVQAWK